MVDDGSQQAGSTRQLALGESESRPLTRRELRKLREAEEAARARQAEGTWEQPTAAESPESEPELDPAVWSTEPEPEPVFAREGVDTDTLPIRAVVPPLPEAPPMSAFAQPEPDQEAGPEQEAGHDLELIQEPAPAVVPERAPEQPAGFIRTPLNVAPRSGLRRLLYRLTGGALNLGPSPAQQAEAELDRRIRRRLDGSRNTAFLSLKGGVGKTSTTVGVGLTLADIRSGTVCAIDANPDAGDLIERALGEGAYESERQLNITRLLRELGDSESRVALDAYLHEVGNLRLLAGEQDPDLSDSLQADDYRRVQGLVSLHYGITLTDCGTGVSRPVMHGILENADNVVVTAGFAVSGAKRARDTLTWLMTHGFGELAQNAVVVVTDKDDVSGRVDKNAIEATLAGMCRTLINVPHDNAVADGDLVSLETVRPETRRAYKEIAAAIVDGYR